MIIGFTCLRCVPAVGGLVQGDPGSSRSVASKSVRKQKAAGKFGSAEPEREPPSFERALAVEHFGVPLPPAGTSLDHGKRAPGRRIVAAPLPSPGRSAQGSRAKQWRLPCIPMGRESKRILSPNPHLPLGRGPVDTATASAATPRRADGHLVSRLTIGAFQTLRPLRGTRGVRVGDVRASRANPATRRRTCMAGDHPRRTHRVDHPSTGRKAAMGRILLWNRHDRCRDLACSTVAWQCRIRRRLCRVRWLRRQYRVTFRTRLLPLSGCSYYIPATAGIDTS